MLYKFLQVRVNSFTGYFTAVSALTTKHHGYTQYSVAGRSGLDFLKTVLELSSCVGLMKGTDLIFHHRFNLHRPENFSSLIAVKATERWCL